MRTHASTARLAIFSIITAAFHAVGPVNAEPGALTKFPQHIDPACNFGRAKLYDECGSQLALFDKALRTANQQDKVLLVSFGAEWCIWCHVFSQHLAGAHTKMDYRLGDPGDPIYDDVTLLEKPRTDPTEQADRLKSFAEDTFVVVHIEDQFSPDGYDVLLQTSAVDAFTGGYPFIFTVTREGQYAARLYHDRSSTRRDGLFSWYRGHDRSRLIAELSRMVAAAE
ncbi:MAG: hypothetical protein AAGE03_03790 [Pseudomonadota bacterium]